MEQPAERTKREQIAPWIAVQPTLVRPGVRAWARVDRARRVASRRWGRSAESVHRKRCARGERPRRAQGNVARRRACSGCARRRHRVGSRHADRRRGSRRSHDGACARLGLRRTSHDRGAARWWLARRCSRERDRRARRRSCGGRGADAWRSLAARGSLRAARCTRAPDPAMLWASHYRARQASCRRDGDAAPWTPCAHSSGRGVPELESTARGGPAGCATPSASATGAYCSTDAQHVKRFAGRRR